MGKQLVKRFLQLIVVLWGVSLLSFSLLHLSPGDPAYIKLSQMGMPPTEELLEKTRHKMGLDKPFITQYKNWAGGILKGDFGTSYQTGKPVSQEFGKKVPNTLRLTLFSGFICLLISFPLGVLAALDQDKFPDIGIRFFSVVALSIPNFYLALVFLFVFGLKLKWFPIMGTEGFKSLIMPSVVLAVVSSGKLIRQIRAALIEELNKDYVRGARALGLTESKVIWQHVFKNASISIFTALGLTIGQLLGGSVAIEVLFNYKGISSQVIAAIGQRDMPMIQMYTLWMATVFTVLNFVIDVSYLVFQPQLRIKERHKL